MSMIPPAGPPLRLLALAAALLAPALAPAAQALRAAGPPRALAAPAPAARPLVSPDGQRIAFTRPDYGGLWTADADGRGVRQVTDAPAAGFGAAWSPDGTAILARPARVDGLARTHTVTVYRLDATGDLAEAVELTDARVRMPDLPQWLGPAHVALHTRGRLETFAVAGDAARAVPDAAVAVARASGLGVADARSGAVRAVDPLAGTPYAGAALLNLAVSPDGGRVAFEAMGGGLYAANVDGSGLVDLGPGSRPAWSPDGRWVAASVMTDDGHDLTGADLVAVRADGSARARLTATPDRLETHPSWTPDGRALVYADLADDRLYALPLAAD